MRGLFGSYRMRRRLAWIGVPLLLAVVVIVGSLKLGNTAETVEIEPRQDDPAILIPAPKTVRATKAEKGEAYETAIRFINTAVRRRDVASSWNIVTPNMRSGYTRRAWSRGEIPVPPYPAKTPRLAPWRVDYQHKNALGLVFWLLPEERRNDVQPMTFFLDLKASGRGKSREWRVDYFAPASANVAAPTASGTDASGIPRLTPAAETLGAKSELGNGWIVVPLAFLGLIVLIPVGFALRGWYLGRRAERAYLRG